MHFGGIIDGKIDKLNLFLLLFVVFSWLAYNSTNNENTHENIVSLQKNFFYYFWRRSVCYVK